MNDSPIKATPLRARWLGKTVLGIGLASLFSDLSHETATSVLPSLLASMGVTAAVLGLIEGAADGFSSIWSCRGIRVRSRADERRHLFYMDGGIGKNKIESFERI